MRLGYALKLKLAHHFFWVQYIWRSLVICIHKFFTSADDLVAHA